MLFHVTHVHTPETCPGHDPEQVKATFGQVMANADEEGFDLIGAWVDVTAHTVFMIVDTDDAGKLFGVLDPALTIGTGDISPIMDATVVLKERSGE